MAETYFVGDDKGHVVRFALARDKDGKRWCAESFLPLVGPGLDYDQMHGDVRIGSVAGSKTEVAASCFGLAVALLSDDSLWQEVNCGTA